MKGYIEILEKINGIKSIYRHETESFMVINSDKDYEIEVDKDILLANKYDCELVLIVSENIENCIVNCLSVSRNVRALEFLDFLFEENGIAEGDGYIASGKMSKVIINVFISQTEQSSSFHYFLQRAETYFKETDVISSALNKFSIEGMKKFHKKNVPWAFVKTSELEDLGKQICVKSLENTAGTHVIVSDDVYIMIGSRGEVYDIKRDKFEKSYIETNEKLNIFESMLDFIPTVKKIDENKIIAIDEIARICYPKDGSDIFAKELHRRTKVFGKNNNKDYFIGKKGDYIAVRTDDLEDIYIIKRDIFFNTYEINDL